MHAFLLSSPAASWHCYQVLAAEVIGCVRVMQSIVVCDIA